ncbi:MAG: hypothetical protein V4667_02555 [Bacteroidota bacterium]
MQKLAFYLFFTLLSLGASAQIKVPYAYIDNPIEMEFDSAFIRKNKIAYIENVNYVRHENDRIVQKGQNNTFIFNKAGLIDTQFVITRINYVHLDTMVLLHYHLPNKTIMRRKAGDHFIATYLTYNDSSQIIKSLTSRETNTSIIPGDFKIGNQKTISEESISYECISPNQIKKNFYNDEGKLFKTAIIIKDSLGRDIEENGTFTATSVKMNYKIKYDDLGRIYEKQYYTDAMGEYSERSVFHYDFNGKLSRGEYYKKDVLQHNKTFYYNSKNGLMESIMLKFPNNNDIEFINYYFHFIGEKKEVSKLASSENTTETTPKPVVKKSPKKPVKKGAKKPVAKGKKK